MTLDPQSLADKLIEFGTALDPSSHPINGGSRDEYIREGALNVAKALYEDISYTLRNLDKPMYDGSEKILDFGRVQISEQGEIFAAGFIQQIIPPPIDGEGSGGSGGGSGGGGGGDTTPPPPGGGTGPSNLIGVDGVDSLVTSAGTESIASGTENFGDPYKVSPQTKSVDYGVAGGNIYENKNEKPPQDLYSLINSLTSRVSDLETNYSDISIIQGEKGEKGEKGDTGDTGPQGPSGTSGSGTSSSGTSIQSYLGRLSLSGTSTSLGFSGLSLTADQKYILRLKLVDNAASVVNISMYINNDAVESNYRREIANRFSAGGGSNNAYVTELRGGGETEGTIEITRDLSGYVRAVSIFTSGDPTNVFGMRVVYAYKTVSDLNSMNLVGDTANCFASGTIIDIIKETLV